MSYYALRPILLQPITLRVLALLVLVSMLFPAPISAQSITPAANNPLAARHVYMPFIQPKAAVATGLPTITNFSASPSTVQRGSSTTLQWSVQDSVVVSISGLGVVTGNSVTVTPTET